jgi:hypothetical protein
MVVYSRVNTPCPDAQGFTGMFTSQFRAGAALVYHAGVLIPPLRPVKGL